MIEINKSSQQIIKESNMRMVFNLIHKHELISRADIKKITSLSATTVSSLVEELMGEGFVIECGVKETGTIGRKAVMLKINSDGGFFIGLDVQKNCITAALCGLDFTLKETMEVPVSKGETLVLAMMQVVSRLGRDKRILGITIGIPGIVDPKTNILISSTVLAAEDAKDMYLILKEALPDVHIFIKNNSGLVALCEKEFGGYEDISNLISIDIDDGVGAGILIDGAIYDGSGLAGEFGHISVDFNGERCKCGSYGCLELYASIPAILKKADAASLDELRVKIDDEDEDTINALYNATKTLVFGINNIVNLLDPELIVIGGAVKTLGNRFLEIIRKQFREIALIKDKNIVFSEISVNPVILGGTRYAFDMIFGI